MKKFLLAFLLFVNILNATEIRVRILTPLKITSVIISPVSGEYTLLGDGKIITDANNSSVFQMIVEGDSIRLKGVEQELGKYATIRLRGKFGAQTFKIKPVVPEGRIRSYEDHLDITVLNKNLFLLNNIDLENYLAGVVEAESGTLTTNEYYKLQAILCRTYALSHLRRHEAEGFHLCDQVHCQAYKSRSSNLNIINSVYETKGLVVVDSDLKLITAAFHSNCGGQTINSEDVWSLPTSYLKSVKDTFCLRKPHARWKREIPKEDWKSYLALKSKDSNAECNANLLNFPQQERGVNFIDKSLKIPLKTIRADWQLRSTYFSIEQKSDSVLFKGKGYGHGVGLCQEGAMRMSELKYSYKDILHFYYRNVHLVDLSVLDFFRQE